MNHHHPFAKKTMAVVRPLVTGAGVRSANKSDLFMEGVPVTPRHDLDSIWKEAKVWLPREIDLGHGYVTHGIKKLIKYKEDVLLGGNATVSRRPSVRDVSL